MRLQAPWEWAGRTLAACELGGDPFVVAFDAQAQAEVSPRQADHLLRYSGLPLTVVPEVAESVAPERPKKAAKGGKERDAV